MNQLKLMNYEWYSRGNARESRNMYLDRMQEAGRNLDKLKKISLEQRQIEALKNNQRIINNLNLKQN